MSQGEAARRIGVSERWARKLLRRMKQKGDRVVVHGLRGKASSRRIAVKVQGEAIAILKQPDWHHFGPTFASEQLGKRHGIEAGLRKSKSHRLRRSGFGELAKWGTAEHDWLEGRGPVRYLVRMINNATSWSWGRFVERDATPHNMGVLWECWRKMAAWWMSTRIAIRCSPWRRGPERAGMPAKLLEI